jgi:O-antigen/teichoic acid export membrane protein
MSIFKNLSGLRKHPVVKSIGIYTSSNFLSKGISFLLLFVFTNPRYLTPSDNGLLSLFNTSIIFLTPFISLGVIQSTGTDFFKMEKKAFKDFFTTGFIMPVVLTLLSIVILLFFHKRLEANFGFPVFFIWLIPVIVFLLFCNEQLLSLMRNNNEPTRYFGINISETIIELGLAVILVLFFGFRWRGRVTGILVAYTLVGIYSIFYFYKKGYLFGRIKRKYIYTELVYAVPIIAMQASLFSMNASDKFFLSKYTNDHNATVGIYSVACVFSSVINILCTALLQYFFPKLFTTLSEKNINYKSIKKHLYLYVTIMICGTILVMGVTPVMYLFINVRYHPALHYIYFLSVGYFLWAISYYFYSFLLFYKQKRKILMLSVCCILVSLACNYFFIQRWAAQGAAVAVCISYFIVLILTLLTNRKHIQLIFSA